MIDSATGFNINQYTALKLLNTTGIKGLWYDYTFYSRPRDMARFGSLILNKGRWGSTTILNDTNYLKAATNTSQNINPSYGYLWWLNGKTSYKLPDVQLSFPGPLVPNAPMEMYAALGKNDQKLYIIPGMDMVIVRMGNSSGQPVAALSSFDNELWGLLKEVFCPNGPVSSGEILQEQLQVYPNPVKELLNTSITEAGTATICDIAGRIVLTADISAGQPVNVSSIADGIYTLRTVTHNGVYTARFVKK